jgi:hypothetical protein
MAFVMGMIANQQYVHWLPFLNKKAESERLCSCEVIGLSLCGSIKLHE